MIIKIILSIALASLLSTASIQAGASVYNFINLIDTINGTIIGTLGNGNAGLGVCKSLAGDNRCTPSSDDNVTVSEILDLHFDKLAETDFNQVVFRGANHNIINPNIEISVNDGSFPHLTSLACD